MTSPLAEILTVLLAYLAGSIPFGLLVARVVAGIDIRTQGSGNIGATNVGRVLGAKWGITVLLLDALKGLLPVWLIPLALSGSLTDRVVLLRVLAGVATIVGHMFPCWLGFRGGKGVATSLGVVLIIAPLGSLAAFIGFVLSMLVSRIVSLSSIIAAIAFAVCQMIVLRPHPFATSQIPVALFSLAVPVLIIVRHSSNIGRLLRGQEKRFEFGKRTEATPQAEAGLSAGDGQQPQRDLN